MAADIGKSTARFARYRALRTLWLRLGSVVALLLLGFFLGRFSGVLDEPVRVALDADIAPSAPASPAMPEAPTITTEAPPSGPFAMPTTVPHSGGQPRSSERWDRILQNCPMAMKRFDYQRHGVARAGRTPAGHDPGGGGDRRRWFRRGGDRDGDRARSAFYPLVFALWRPYREISRRKPATRVTRFLLHMPMQPSGAIDPGPNALLSGLSAAEIRQRLGAAFARVPQAVGLNNHMGSLLTTDAERWRWCSMRLWRVA